MGNSTLMIKDDFFRPPYICNRKLANFGHGHRSGEDKIMSTKNRLSSLLVVCFFLLIVLNSPAQANYAVKQITDNSWTYNPK